MKGKTVYCIADGIPSTYPSSRPGSKVQNEKFPERSFNVQNWEAGGTRQQCGGVFFSYQMVKEEKNPKFTKITRIVLNHSLHLRPTPKLLEEVP